MMIDFDQINEYLQNGNLAEISRETNISYRTLQDWKLENNNWLKQAEERLTKIQTYIQSEEKKIEQERISELEKKQFNIEPE